MPTAATLIRPEQATAAGTAVSPVRRRRAVRGHVTDAGDLLLRLRGAGTGRAPVDPYLSGGLRAWLEDAVASAPADARSPGEAIGDALHASGGPSPLERARRLLDRTLFRLVVTGHALDDPFEEALGALRAGGGTCPSPATMHDTDCAALRAVVGADGAGIAADWRRPPPAWLPRTAERLCAPLGAGHVVLRATADLVLGSPSEGTASVCLVSVETGAPGDAHARGRRHLALIETLRSGAPPFRVATYHAGSRVLVCDDVTEHLLVDAVHDVVHGLGAR